MRINLGVAFIKISVIITILSFWISFFTPMTVAVLMAISLVLIFLGLELEISNGNLDDDEG